MHISSSWPPCIFHSTFVFVTKTENTQTKIVSRGLGGFEAVKKGAWPLRLDLRSFTLFHSLFPSSLQCWASAACALPLVSALPKIHAKRKYLYDEGGNRFYIKAPQGMAYQEAGELGLESEANAVNGVGRLRRWKHRVIFCGRAMAALEIVSDSIPYRMHK
ncbi:unnamed protein product [Rhizoctonia solani]|uniref:Uncharacterized protein n=1 Tax=Rhizoctonia solani TaxID=456999 RepID=A0A8H3E3M4_9AGAM|nr:unnamed protein product [Rhizoctonia solani]